MPDFIFILGSFRWDFSSEEKSHSEAKRSARIKPGSVTSYEADSHLSRLWIAPKLKR